MMKRNVPTFGGNGMADSETPADVAEGVGGQLLPKLGKLKDVTRQRRGDILGARGAVKVQGKRCVCVCSCKYVFFRTLSFY